MDAKPMRSLGTEVQVVLTRLPSNICAFDASIANESQTMAWVRSLVIICSRIALEFAHLLAVFLTDLPSSVLGPVLPRLLESRSERAKEAYVRLVDFVENDCIPAEKGERFSHERKVSLDVPI